MKREGSFKYKLIMFPDRSADLYFHDLHFPIFREFISPVGYFFVFIPQPSRIDHIL